MQPLSFIILAVNTYYLSPERERGGGGVGRFLMVPHGFQGGAEYKGSSIRNRLSINCVGRIMSGIIRILESLGGGGGGVG